MREFTISVDTLEKGQYEEIITVKQVIVVGYGGRDIEKVEEHIAELAEIGVAPPETIPAIYPQDVSSINLGDKIDVEGKETSGEAEYVLFHNGEEWLVTLGSDHTDRFLETKDILKSKQACPKPLADVFWRLEDIKDHWDELYLRSWIKDEKGKRKYQEDSLHSLLPVETLLEKLKEFGYRDLSNTVIFSGTVPTLEGFVYGEKFQYELADAKLNRRIESAYCIKVTEGQK